MKKIAKTAGFSCISEKIVLSLRHKKEWFMEIINRKQYVDRVLGYLGKGLILVLTGQRRVGKSCILQSVAKQITAKDDSANVIYINKEYAEFNSLKTDEDLNEYVAAHLKDQRHN